MTPTFKTKKIILNKKVKRKISFGIISVVMVGIFLLPISPSFDLQKGSIALNLKTNIAKAETPGCGINLQSTITTIASDGFGMTLKIKVRGKAIDNDPKDDKIDTTGIVGDLFNSYKLYAATVVGIAQSVIPGNIMTATSCWLTVNTSTSEAGMWAYVLKGPVSKTTQAGVSDFYLPSDRFDLWVSTDPTLPKDGIHTFHIPINNIVLTAEEQTLNVTVNKNQANVSAQGINAAIKDAKTLYAQFTLKTYLDVEQNINSDIQTINLKTDTSTIGSETAQSVTDITKKIDFGCGITSLGGCIAQIFYVFWTVAALFAKLGAKFLDFFVYYSTNSSSYTSNFISKGWAGVRDIANMFFIIALLYVAIKTILGLNVSNNKKVIGYVVVVALLLNFSLFTTQVIIDQTNVLAKIFYNNITSVDASGKTISAESGGQKSISVGLVSLFDPQNIFTQEIFDQGVGTFIFVTALLIAIMLYMAYMFFAVAVLFVARTISLWISMIFSPIAFASYTVPFKIPGFGHEEWWDDLFKNAFLAPIFVFMLYLVVMFAGFLKDIQYADGDVSTTAGLFQHIMSVVIPFILLFVLLMKAKELAVKYSGEMGAAIMKGAQMIGGLAVGAAMGGVGILGRATLGRAGSAIANSETIKSWERKGYIGAKTLRNIGTAGAKGSMDLRGVKIAGKDFGGLTGMKVGKQKEGGYDKMRADKTAKRMARAKELEPGEDSKVVQDLHKAERQQKALENEYGHKTTQLQAEVDTARLAMTDAKGKSDADPKNEKKKEAYLEATKALQKKQDELSTINNGGFDAANNKYRTTNGNITKKEHDDITAVATKAATAAANTGTVETAAINEASAKQIEATNKAGEEETKAIADATKTKEEAISKAQNELSAALTAAAVSKTSFGDRHPNTIAAQQAAAAASTKLTNIETTQNAAIAAVTRDAATKKAQAISDAASEYAEAVREANDEKTRTLAANTTAKNAKTTADASANRGYGESITSMKKEVVPHAHHEYEKAKNKSNEEFSKLVGSRTNKTLNMITSFGQHSNNGADEASHKIFMNMKTETKGH
ncbi:MAG: hypothetical protein WCI41_00245 [bacterium]